MQLLSKAISYILLSATDITDVVGSGNIWHAKIPQRSTAGTDEPVDTSVLFYVYAITPNDNKSGRSEVDEIMVRVHVIGSDDEDLSNVAKYVRYSLDRIQPGEYAGIYIDGSRFLNAYFEPDDAYVLEQQEYILEFQFRVIDPDIRTPGGAIPSLPGFSGHYKTTEQVWPFSKWVNGETVHWITVPITSSSGFETINYPEPSDVSEFVEVTTISKDTTTGEVSTYGAVLKEEGGVYKYDSIPGCDYIYLILKYVKA